MQSRSGFTIVELLIVIVVVAILAAISLIAYTGFQTRAHAAAVVSDLRATEKALRAYMVTSGAGDWWRDTSPVLSGTTGGNPDIDEIIDFSPEFRAFLQEEPTTKGLNTPNDWFYDNDGDTYNGCSASTAGVSLILFNPQNTALVQAIDTAIDDGNLACGKVRMSGSNFTYGLE